MRSNPLVLVIEDSKPIRDILRFGLENIAGFDVVEAEDGPLGLFKADEVAPDLILLDWIMPRMNGLEVLTELKQRHETAKTPVYMLTRKGLMGDVQDATEAGAVGYFTKPFNIKELCARLTSSIHAREVA